MKIKTRSIKRIIYFTILLPSILISPAYSHPHIYIDNSAEFVFGEEGLEGIQLTWVFNEMFSSTFIQDYDSDEDGSFSDKELEVIQDEMFSSLEDYDYFSHVTIDGEEFKVEKINGFSASILDEVNVVYAFFIPCEAAVQDEDTTLVLSVYDETYYIAVEVAEENPVQARNIDIENYSYEVKDNPEKPYYYGQIIPGEIIFKFRK